MPSFNDSQGRQWPVTITVATVKRVRNLLDVDLYRLIDDGCKPLAELLSDPVRFVDVLYVICKPEADAAGVSDEQFGSSLGGDSLAQAVEAFMGAYTDFIPNPQVRDSLRAMTRKSAQVRERLTAKLSRLVEAIDPEKFAAELERRASSGASPAPSESTPGPSPSAS